MDAAVTVRDHSYALDWRMPELHKQVRHVPNEKFSQLLEQAAVFVVRANRYTGHFPRATL